MSEKNFKEQSRLNWRTEDNVQISNEQLALGCFQRIADATEAMAGNYLNLQKAAERYERWYNNEKEARKQAELSNRALRGHITRLKNLLLHVSGK